MKIFDAQIRSDTRTDDELRNLAYFDTQRVVTTAHAPRAFRDATELLGYLRGLVDTEVGRLRRCGLHGSVALGVLPAARPQRAHPEVYRELPHLLTHDDVVAVGEVGAWEDSASHWSLFDRQVKLALEAGLPVIVTPPASLRITMTYKMMSRLVQLGLAPTRCLMNLLDERLLPTVAEEGFIGGVAVGYRQIEPRQAAALLIDVLEKQPEAIDRLVLNSSLRRGAADILGIPKTIVALQEAGAAADVIQQLAYDNAERLFVRTEC